MPYIGPELDEIDDKEEILEAVQSFLKKKKVRSAISTFLLSAVLVAFFAGAAWMIGRNHAKEEVAALYAEIEDYKNRIAELIINPIVVEPIAPVINLDTINKEIHEIGELATVEYMYTNAAVFSQSKHAKIFKEFEIPFTEKTFTAKWDGVIKAGVDISKINIDLDEKTKVITVLLPPAEILSHDIDEDSYEILNESNNKFNPLTIHDKVSFDAATEKEMKEKAINNGILDKAQASAEKIICNIITGSAGVTEDYQIHFMLSKE